MTLMNKEMEVVHAVLAVMRQRKKNFHDHERLKRDVEEVIEALKTSGYMVIPKGSWNALVGVIQKIEGRKKHD